MRWVHVRSRVRAARPNQENESSGLPCALGLVRIRVLLTTFNNKDYSLLLYSSLFFFSSFLLRLASSNYWQSLSPKPRGSKTVDSSSLAKRMPEGNRERWAPKNAPYLTKTIILRSPPKKFAWNRLCRRTKPLHPQQKRPLRRLRVLTIRLQHYQISIKPLRMTVKGPTKVKKKKIRKAKSDFFGAARYICAFWCPCLTGA